MIDKIRLGDSELFVSILCLGGMNFGWKEPREASLDTLNRYAEAGGNFIDTANVYTRREAPGFDLYGKDIDKFEDGISERLIGDWLKEGKRREDFVIASKVGFAYPGIEIGTSKAQIKAECEKSLLRLKTDYIDLYYLHMDDRKTPFEESLGALTNLVKEGKIRYIGLSNFTAERLSEACEIAECCGFEKILCLQNKFSYLRPRPDADFMRQAVADDKVFRVCEKNRIQPIAYSPLLKGYYGNRTKVLDEKYVWQDSDNRLKVLDEVAKEIGATASQVVYAWLLSHRPKVLPIVATSKKEQLDETIASLKLNLTPEQIKRLNEAGI